MRSRWFALLAASLSASAHAQPVTTLFVATARPAADRAMVGAPWSLTASDGSGLRLTRIDARAVVEGPLAFTELHLYFHNPEARTREGTFAIRLPTGAAVSRFAMETNGELLEAEVVEKQAARRAYEDFLHRKQDPALLEKAAGNQFSARVFPIAANADKHVVISYSQEVAPGHYTLPLFGLPAVDQVDVRVQVRGKDGALAEQRLHERGWLPDRDVVVDAHALAVPEAIAAGDLVATHATLALANAAEPPASVTLLVDTSASRALGFARQARTVRQLVDQLARDFGGALPVQVVAFDQTTAPLYDGRADQIGNIEAALTARGALGASDLGQALTWLGHHAAKSRVIVIGDGVITAGADVAALPALVKQLRGVERVDVALTGGIRDDQAAAAIAHAGLAHAGAVVDLDRGVAEAARRIGLAVRTNLPVDVDGARWVFPRTIAAAQSGDEVTVYARRDVKLPVLSVHVAGQTVGAAPLGVNPALLGRAVAGAEIAELDGQLAAQIGPAADKLRADIVRRSLAARVVSSQTSLLVLETAADYARFGIDRHALADILTVGPAGVELGHRTLPVMIAVPAPVPKTPPRKVAAKDDRAAGVHLSAEMLENPLGGAEAGSAAGGAPAAEADPATADAPADEHADERAAIGHLERLQAEAAPPPASPVPMAAAVESRRPAASGAVSRELIAREQGSFADLGRSGAPALSGPLADIERAITAGHPAAALARATDWHARHPDDVLALIGLGDALEASHDLATAARAYGSIIDLYPARADFRRFAGERLERLGQSRDLTIDTYRRAVADRPDHLTGHRLLAYALVRDGQYAEAFAAILAGLDRRYPAGRFAGGERVLADDAAMIGAAYAAHDPAHRATVVAELTKRHLALATQPSTRFILYWETDGNDVDFHIRDGRGGHAWYANKQLRSGGELYADVTTGYGPECFAIPGTPAAGPYQLAINYFSQGPMGYGMGLLQIQSFDGRGNLKFEDRPYVIMNDRAFVDLGSYP